MGYPTPIEWTDATWNPVGGCDIHSPGCINCYAQRIAGSPRLRNHPLYSGVTKVVKGKPVFNGMLTALPPDHPGWQFPLRWRGAKQPKLGPAKPSLIFVGDMADLMHRDRASEDIDRTVLTIMLSKHIGLFLTKRADVLTRYFSSDVVATRLIDQVYYIEDGGVLSGGATNWHHPRLWLGFSAERQQEFDERWRHFELLARAGWQVFVSCEPLLGRILLPGNLKSFSRKPWIIAGGESGPDARPAHPDWFRLLRDQCDEQGLPFFFKQHGEWTSEGQISEIPRGRFETYEWEEGAGICSIKLGKKRTGARLDGREYLAFPEAA